MASIYIYGPCHFCSGITYAYCRTEWSLWTRIWSHYPAVNPTLFSRSQLVLWTCTSVTVIKLLLCLFQKKYLDKDAKSIFSPVQALAKSTSYVIRNLSPSGHTYFNYHHLCKIHTFLQHRVLQGAQWDQTPQWTQCHCLQNILGHWSAQLLTESTHKDPGKAGERGRAHTTYTCLVLFRKWPLLSDSVLHIGWLPCLQQWAQGFDCLGRKMTLSSLP